MTIPETQYLILFPSTRHPNAKSAPHHIIHRSITPALESAQKSPHASVNRTHPPTPLQKPVRASLRTKTELRQPERQNQILPLYEAPRGLHGRAGSFAWGLACPLHARARRHEAPAGFTTTHHPNWLTCVNARHPACALTVTVHMRCCANDGVSHWTWTNDGT